MPMHDWTRVSAGTYHDFHCAWITHLKEALNSGRLPRGFYALAEQHAGSMIADVLTLQVPPESDRAPRSNGAGRDDGPGGLAVAAPARPKVGRRLLGSPDVEYRRARHSLAIRHGSGHRLVALVEIASPGNKDRATSVDDFARKVHEALRAGVNVLLVDPLPPGPHDPRGLHGAVWDGLGDESDLDPAAPPLTLASYIAGRPTEAYVESIGVGDPLPPMPLFIDLTRHVETPLEESYAAAYRGLPEFWRGVIEGQTP